MKKITARCEADGHLRYGHYDLELTDEEYAEFSQLDDDSKKEWIKSSGKFTLDDWEVYDTYSLEIEEVE